MIAQLTPLTGRRVLLVEDEALVAMQLEEMLADLGCVVAAVAATLPRGLQAAADPGLAIDAALLDVNLGGDKVFPIAEALLARGVPFVFSTGYGLAGIAPDFRFAPALAKPYDASVLERALLAVIGGRPQA